MIQAASQEYQINNEESQNLKEEFRVFTRRKLTDKIFLRNREKLVKQNLSNNQQNGNQIINGILSIAKKNASQYINNDPHKLEKHIKDQCQKLRRIIQTIQQQNYQDQDQNQIYRSLLNNLQYIIAILHQMDNSILEIVLENKIQQDIFWILENSNNQFEEKYIKICLQIILQIVSYDNKIWGTAATSDDRFCTFFFHYFESQNDEFCSIATKGIGNIILDYPAIKQHFFAKNMQQIFINKLRLKQDDTKIFTRNLWFLQVLCQRPYEYVKIVDFFPVIDQLIDKYRDQTEVVSSLVRCLYELTLDEYQNQFTERVMSCASLRSLAFLIGSFESFPNKVRAQIMELLFNCTLVVDQGLACHMIKLGLLKLIKQMLDSVDYDIKIQGIYLFYNMCFQSSFVIDQMIAYDDSKLIKLMIIYSHTDSHQNRIQLYTCLGLIVKSCNENILCGLLSMGVTGTLAESFEFIEELEMCVHVLGAIKRCLIWNKQFFGIDEMNQEQDLVKMELEEKQFGDVLDQLMLHKNEVLSREAMWISESFQFKH